MENTFWDKRSKHYDGNIRKHDTLYLNTIESTKSLLKRSDKVLDFGCATGEMSLDIAPYVHQVHGIDTSEKMIELADQKTWDRQTDNTVFNQMDVFDDTLKANSFHAIIAFNMFHLVGDIPKILTRLNELLTDNGILISQTPCLGERGWFFKAVINLVQKLGMAPPILNLSATALESTVIGNGFNISETRILDKKNKVQWIVARKK